MKAQQNAMPTVISALTARTQLGQILQRAKAKERFLIGRRGQPQAVVLGIEDFLEIVAPAPGWLERSWKAAERNGTDKLTMREIDAVVAETRGVPTKKAAKSPRK